ncbi:MAG: DUF1289 domain-containing protein [Deltaproteobacteria bacterium]|nr:DUF1289 domain-containing protein [Deltaproteobacteria bacterium]HCH64815.1 DUF1289 domain-containing protein [Deltaproteobacteria bacterium]
MSKRSKHPCVGVCVYIGPKRWCLACGLTSSECRTWRSMKPYGRNVLLKELERRKAELKARRRKR